MSYHFLEIVRTYQILFAGLIGFTGVILTMFANARIQKRQYERKMDHDSNSVRTALKSELVINRQTFKERVKQLENGISHNAHALVPTKVFDSVYQKLTPKIGLLAQEEIEAVIQAYLLLAELPFKLRVLVGTDCVQGINGEFIRLVSEKREEAMQLHQPSIILINKAIEVLSENSITNLGTRTE